MKEYKILLVDDQPDVISSIVDIFEDKKYNYVFYQSLNGVMAYEVAKKVMPDLIITDWEMPICNGIELIQKLKDTPELKEIPVIICTGIMTSSENLKTAFEAGAVDYIRKPIDVLELEARIRSMLTLSEKNIENIKLNKNKDLLFSILGHDLRNSIGGVNAYLNLLKEETTKYSIDDIKAFGQMSSRMNKTYSLLENLLMWGQLSTIDEDTDEEPIDIDELVACVVDSLTNDIEEKSILLLQHTANSPLLCSNENTLITVIRNLLSNAIKFSNRGGTIIVKCDFKGDKVEVSVTDNGVGMTEETIAKINNEDSFYSSMGTNDEKGSGLGLKLCKQLLLKSNSKLSFTSTENKGSRFFFDIAIAN